MTVQDNERLPDEEPQSELQRERDSFIQTFFRKGAQFTQELVNENTRLAGRLTELENENVQLRAQIASNEAIRELLRKIDSLEKERTVLASQFEEVEAASVRLGDQYSEVEGELGNLANLYIASYQLHSSLDTATTLRHMRELLEQLVGARTFGVYLVSSDRKVLHPVLLHGSLKADSIPVRADDGGIGEVFSTNLARIQKGDLRRGSLENPVALVPMKVEDQVVGVLAIFDLFEQKSRFLQVDFELFKLFGAHAGRALVCARIFLEAGQKLPSFDSLYQRDV